MKLRDNFPKTADEAKIFDVEIRDELAIFKIFEAKETMEATVGEVNVFLANNGYDQIDIPKFIDNEYNYESKDEIVSLSPHGYIEALVLFIEKELGTIVVEISKKVLGRLTTIGYEKNTLVSTGQLIFPSKSDDKRISEQELRQLFIEEFKDKYKKLYFSIETPTVYKYSFTNELNEIKVSENGQSALLDMCVFEKKDKKSNYYRLLNIEFKHKNATEANISKDILKLIHEEENGAFILLLKNTDSGTLTSVFKKFSNSFDKHKKQWKGEKDKFIQLVIISLEEETNKNKTAFFIYKNVFENDLETIKENIGNEWI